MCFSFLGSTNNNSKLELKKKETDSNRWIYKRITQVKDLLKTDWKTVHGSRNSDFVSFLSDVQGSKEHVENLEWSYQAIRNSCDEEMKQILDTKLIGVASEDLSGPLVYWHLLTPNHYNKRQVYSHGSKKY